MFALWIVLCAALPPEKANEPKDATESPVSSLSSSHIGVDVTTLAVCGAILVVTLLIIIVWCCSLWRKKYLDKKPPSVPAVHFDLSPRIVVEESIDFVVPPLQSPRTLKAGAATFEFGSSEQLQMNLYEPVAREYRPPSVAFSLEHDRENKLLIVKLSGARDITPSKVGVNPVVKVTLLPEKIKYLSRVAKDTIRPVFGDVFNFELSDLVPIEVCSLKFSLYNQEKLGRRVLLAKALLPLKRTLHQGERWLPLDGQKSAAYSFGEVTVRLEQTEEAFICTVLAVRGVPKDILLHIKMGVYINHRHYRKTRSGPFQALGGVKELNQRLEVARADIPVKDLSNLQVIISLCGRKKRLAKCHVGPRSSVEGIEHWAEMLNKGRSVRAHRFLPG